MHARSSLEFLSRSAQWESVCSAACVQDPNLLRGSAFVGASQMLSYPVRPTPPVLSYYSNAVISDHQDGSYETLFLSSSLLLRLMRFLANAKKCSVRYKCHDPWMGTVAASSLSTS